MDCIVVMHGQESSALRAGLAVCHRRRSLPFNENSHCDSQLRSTFNDESSNSPFLVLSSTYLEVVVLFKCDH